MSATATATGILTTITQKTVEVFGTITVATGTYTAGGLTLDLSGTVIAPSAPLFVDIHSVQSPNSGYVYNYAMESLTLSPPVLPTQANGKLVISAAPSGGGALTEITGSVPSAVLTDNITFHAIFGR